MGALVGKSAILLPEIIEELPNLVPAYLLTAYNLSQPQLGKLLNFAFITIEIKNGKQ